VNAATGAGRRPGGIPKTAFFQLDGNGGGANHSTRAGVSGQFKLQRLVGGSRRRMGANDGAGRMDSLQDAVASTVAAITAMGTLGAAAFGLVDATKAFGGGVSNFGFGHVLNALAPFRASLDQGSPVWRESLRANWINGVPKEQQKESAKSLIRLGLSSSSAATLAAAAKVDAKALQAAMAKVEANAGAAPDQQQGLTAQDALVLGRLNAAVDAAMDAGFERADQQYRNASRVTAGLFAIGLSLWAGSLLLKSGAVPGLTTDNYFQVCIFVGLLATPIAPIAKDLASSLQAAAAAVSAAKP
jgi:hypothetical protein